MARFNTFVFQGYLVFLGTSCSTTTIHYQQQMPAEIAVVPTKHTIVLEKFSGPDAREVSGHIEEVLEENQFEVISRKMHDRELRLLGNRNNSSYILISGDILRSEYEEKKERDQMRCERSSEKRQGFRYSVTGEAHVQVRLSISAMSTGEVVFADAIEGFDSDSLQWIHCGERVEEVPRIDERQLRTQALVRLKRAFSHVIAPYRKVVDITLFKGDDNLLPELNQGHQLFQANRLPDAIRMYRLAVDRAEKNGRVQSQQKGHAYYALGIALGYHGDKEGFRFLDQAYRLNPESEYLQERSKMETYFTYNRSRFLKAAGNNTDTPIRVW